MPADFNGKWKMDRTEGAAEFIKALGIPADKVPKSADLEIKQNGDDEFTFQVVTEKATRNHSVTVGKSFKESILGVDFEGAARWDGDRLVTANDKGTEITREIIDGELVVTMTVKGVTAKRIFKKC